MFLTRRRKRFKFTERTHSKKGMISCLFSVANLAGFVVILTQAFHSDGSLSTYYGSAGVCLLVLSIGMLLLSIQSLAEEDSYPLFPRLSLLLSIFSVGCWIGTYAVGFGIIG